MELSPVRIGLWDQYGGSMPSGWTRMILEDFEFDFDVLYPPDFDTADLNEYDVLVFEDGALPAATGGGGRGGGPEPATITEEFRRRIGRVPVDQTVPRILDNVRGGVAVVAIGTLQTLRCMLGFQFRITWLKMENRFPVKSTLPRDQYST